MKRLLFFLLSLFVVSAVSAQTGLSGESSDQAALSKYKVLKTADNDAFLESVSQLADQGYRVIVQGPFTILHLEAVPPDTYRYLRLEGRSGPAQFSNWLNDQGAHGYRWRRRTGLLEKEPHPKNYEYRNSPHGALGPSKGRELSALVEEGFRPVSIAYFSHALRAATNEMYFEHEIGQPAVATSLAPGSEIRVADAMRAGNVLKQVNEFSAQGYRFLAPHASNKGGGIAVMMEKCLEDCTSRYEYRYFDAKSQAQIEADLKVLGNDGFRVLPDALALRPHLLERDTRNKNIFGYRVVESRDAAQLEQSLNAPESDGFAPLDFVWRVGWTAEAFLVMEKSTTATTPVATNP